MRIRHGVAITAIFLGVSSSVFAVPITAYVYFGGNLTRLKNNLNVTVDQSGTINTYHTYIQDKTGVLAGFSMQSIYDYHAFKITIGPAYYFIDLSDVNGLEYPDSGGGTFDTLDYRFDVHSHALFVETHLIYKTDSFQPYFVIGVGSAWNRLSHYREVPTDPASSAAPANSFYRNHFLGEFAFEVGAGLSHNFYTDKKHGVSYDMGAEYRYYHLGDAKFLAANGQTTNNALEVSRINSSALMVTLNAVFED